MHSYLSFKCYSRSFKSPGAKTLRLQPHTELWSQKGTGKSHGKKVTGKSHGKKVTGKSLGKKVTGKSLGKKVTYAVKSSTFRFSSLHVCLRLFLLLILFNTWYSRTLICNWIITSSLTLQVVLSHFQTSFPTLTNFSWRHVGTAVVHFTAWNIFTNNAAMSLIRVI